MKIKIDNSGDTDFENYYLDHAQKFCQLIDLEYAKNNISAWDKKKLILALATYFCGSTMLKNRVPQIRNLAQNMRKDEYFRFSGYSYIAQIQSYWESIISKEFTVTLPPFEKLFFELFINHVFPVTSSLNLMDNLIDHPQWGKNYHIDLASDYDFEKIFSTTKQNNIQFILTLYNIFWFIRTKTNNNSKQNLLEILKNHASLFKKMIDKLNIYIQREEKAFINEDINNEIKLSEIINNLNRANGLNFMDALNVINIIEIENGQTFIAMNLSNPCWKNWYGNPILRSIFILETHKNSMDPICFADSVFEFNPNTPSLELLNSIIENLKIPVEVTIDQSTCESLIIINQNNKSLVREKEGYDFFWEKIKELDENIKSIINNNEVPVALEKYLPIIKKTYIQAVNAKFYKSPLILCFLLEKSYHILSEMLNAELNAINLYAKYMEFFEQIKSITLLRADKKKHLIKMGEDCLKTDIILYKKFGNKMVVSFRNYLQKSLFKFNIQKNMDVTVKPLNEGKKIPSCHPIYNHIFSEMEMRSYYCPYSMSAISVILNQMMQFTGKKEIAYDATYFESINILNQLKKSFAGLLTEINPGGAYDAVFSEKVCSFDQINTINEDGILFLDITRFVSDTKLLEMYQYINDNRKDLTLVITCSLSKYPAFGTNIALGYVMVNASSPLLEYIESDLKKMNALANPLQIKFFEAINIDSLKKYELDIRNSSNKVFELLSNLVKKHYLFYRYKHNCLVFMSSKENLNWLKKAINTNLEKNGYKQNKIIHISAFGAPCTTGTFFNAGGSYTWRINVGTLTDKECICLAQAINLAFEQFEMAKSERLKALYKNNW